jgi:hypothetical protein
LRTCRRTCGSAAKPVQRLAFWRQKMRSSCGIRWHFKYIIMINCKHMGMDQYLLIPFLVGWTSIYQLFWCSPGVQGFDTLPYLFIEEYGSSNHETEATRHKDWRQSWGHRTTDNF